MAPLQEDFLPFLLRLSNFLRFCSNTALETSDYRHSKDFELVYKAKGGDEFVASGTSLCRTFSKPHNHIGIFHTFETFEAQKTSRLKHKEILQTDTHKSHKVVFQENAAPFDVQTTKTIGSAYRNNREMP